MIVAELVFINATPFTDSLLSTSIILQTAVAITSAVDLVVIFVAKTRYPTGAIPGVLEPAFPLYPVQQTVLVQPVRIPAPVIPYPLPIPQIGPRLPIVPGPPTFNFQGQPSYLERQPSGRGYWQERRRSEDSYSQQRRPSARRYSLDESPRYTLKQNKLLTPGPSSYSDTDHVRPLNDRVARSQSYQQRSPQDEYQHSERRPYHLQSFSTDPALSRAYRPRSRLEEKYSTSNPARF
nr:hypothetical protein L203_00800 [Cryptococcus depauperatus CBS 7841]